MSGPDLEVVIVSHGASDLLANCLGSLRKHPASLPMRVTVVDSGSPDETPGYGRTRFFSRGAAIAKGKHRFSAANNPVLDEVAARSGARLVLLLNPDTEVLKVPWMPP